MASECLPCVGFGRKPLISYLDSIGWLAMADSGKPASPSNCYKCGVLQYTFWYYVSLSNMARISESLPEFCYWAELQTMEGRIASCPLPRSPIQTPGLSESPRSVGSPRYRRAPIQISGLMDSPCSVGSPRSLRSSSHTSGFVESPHSVGSPRSLHSPRLSPSPSFGKQPQV